MIYTYLKRISYDFISYAAAYLQSINKQTGFRLRLCHLFRPISLTVSYQKMDYLRIINPLHLVLFITVIVISPLVGTTRFLSYR